MSTLIIEFVQCGECPPIKSSKPLSIAKGGHDCAANGCSVSRRHSAIENEVEDPLQLALGKENVPLGEILGMAAPVLLTFDALQVEMKAIDSKYGFPRPRTPIRSRRLSDKSAAIQSSEAVMSCGPMDDELSLDKLQAELDTLHLKYGCSDSADSNGSYGFSCCSSSH